MIPTKAFVLCAGLGTRFKPQSLFCPKPALPIYNIPQALYSASALKEVGVSEFYYNSHHLPKKLEQHLKPFFKNEPYFEKALLDSAGGIANAFNDLKNDDSFWVVNGDSFIHYENTNFLSEAFEMHKKNEALATLIGVSEKKADLNGLSFDSNNRFLGLTRDQDSLHFIGLYLLNTEIFKSLSPSPLKLFGDVLLQPDVQERVFIYQAPPSIKWFETGNEKDFIDCLKFEASSLKDQKNESFVYKTHKNWGLTKDLDLHLERFLKERHWGLNSYQSSNSGDFVCVPDHCEVNKNALLKNTVLMPGLNLDSEAHFEEKVLVDSSQWR